jgi:hypothetical protein
MIVRETWSHALHKRMNCYAVGKLFLQAAYPIRSRIFEYVVLSYTCIRFGLQFVLLVPGERMGTTPPLPVLLSKTRRPF